MAAMQIPFRVRAQSARRRSLLQRTASQSLSLALLCLAALHPSLASVTNLQALASIGGSAAVQVREGTPGNSFKDSSTNLPAIVSQSVTAAAGPARATASASANASATI